MTKETSLDKALTVIDAVAAAGQIGVRALAERTGYPPATIHRILGVLVKRRYLIQEPTGREYRLSWKLLELSVSFRESLDIISVARPVMRELVESVGETVNLVVFDGGEAIYIDQVDNSQSMLRMFTRVGGRVPLYCSGVGKVFLAGRPRAEVLDYWAGIEPIAFTERTIIDRDAFLTELAAIRDQGFAVDNEEREQGVRCVAAAIGPTGLVEAALSISGPSSRVTEEKTPSLGREAAAAARRISTRLGYGLG